MKILLMIFVLSTSFSAIAEKIVFSKEEIILPMGK